MSKIGIKLSAAFLAIIALLGVAIALSLGAARYGQQGYVGLIESDIRIGELARDIGQAMLQCRRNEKDFLLDRTMERAEQFDASLSELLALSEELASTARAAENEDVAAQADEVAELAEAYAEAFRGVVGSYERMGLDHESGLQGAFRAEVRALEESLSALDANEAVIALLQLRRNEKDYLLRFEDRYVTAVQETAGQLSGMVASAIEELSSSLREVAHNTNQTSSVVTQATEMAGTTATTIEELGRSAKSIGAVVDLIADIATQTNLLALNASIEAASSGEAGKGFAVVANEVKELAQQTNRATEDIREHVTRMQTDTNGAVLAIRSIVEVVARVNTAFAAIAAAVNEQTLAVNEIARSVSEASQSSTDVSRNVQEVAGTVGAVSENIAEASRAIQDTVRSISELAVAANDISRQSAEASHGMDQVSGNVDAVAQATVEVRSGADVVAESSNELAGLASRLQGLVGQFSV